ncbi:MAG: hypothetical protein U5K76_04075 [Woeseiaceae bacterium]|nr:hypothetical protein [Woeseiaceae bacterium]
MNLLSLIIIFLALAMCGAIAYIAWELSSDREHREASQSNHRPDDEPPA